MVALFWSYIASGCIAEGITLMTARAIAEQLEGNPSEGYERDMRKSENQQPGMAM
jgi:hypothetical protein